MVKLLISAAYEEEVDVLYEIDGVDIVDLKDVRIGESLGAPDLDLVSYAIEKKPPDKELSVPLGDVSGPVSGLRICAKMLDYLNVDYVKVGLYVRSFEDGVKIGKLIRDALTHTRLVLVGYADYREHGVLSPEDVVEICRKVDADVAMVDTRSKHGKSTLSYLHISELAKFVETAHLQGMEVAIAGGLSMDDVLYVITRLDVDIVGVRSCVCESSRESLIDPEKVLALAYAVRHIMPFLET